MLNSRDFHYNIFFKKYFLISSIIQRLNTVMSLYFPNLKMRLTFRKKAIKKVNGLSNKSYEDSHNVKNAKKISSRFRSKTLTTLINKVEIKN